MSQQLIDQDICILLLQNESSQLLARRQEESQDSAVISHNPALSPGPQDVHGTDFTPVIRLRYRARLTLPKGDHPVGLT